jgi:hypothetical protein
MDEERFSGSRASVSIHACARVECALAKRSWRVPVELQSAAARRQTSSVCCATAASGSGPSRRSARSRARFATAHTSQYATSASRPVELGDRCILLHDGDGVVAVDKPPWLPMQRTRASARFSLEAALRAQLGDPSLVAAHRLDRQTSGVPCSRAARPAPPPGRALLIARRGATWPGCPRARRDAWACAVARPDQEREPLPLRAARLPAPDAPTRTGSASSARGRRPWSGAIALRPHKLRCTWPRAARRSWATSCTAPTTARAPGRAERTCPRRAAHASPRHAAETEIRAPLCRLRRQGETGRQTQAALERDERRRASRTVGDAMLRQADRSATTSVAAIAMARPTP